MEVFLITTWLLVVYAEFYQNYTAFESFMNQNYTPKKKLRPTYHIYAPIGRLYNPSAFVYFKHQYHLFYELHTRHGSIRWGHVISDNLVEWSFFQPALLPKDHYDKNGCLAGSAVVQNGYLTLLYTGNYVQNNKTYQTQNIAISRNGIFYKKYLYNPLLRIGPHGKLKYKNPKVWAYRNFWYMFISASKKKQGFLALYTSPDLFNWQLQGPIIKSNGDTGEWGYPDFFQLNQHHIIILSAKDIRSNGKFKNLYQSGYIVGQFNYQSLKFDKIKITRDNFNQLDYGHDFYAAKTMRDPNGRRVLVACLGVGNYEFKKIDPEMWINTLTVLRELKLTNNSKLLMTPLREMVKLRGDIDEDAWYSPGESFRTNTRAFEMLINSSTPVYDAIISFDWNDGDEYSISYSAANHDVTVDRGGVDGVRKAEWKHSHHLYWQIFVDYNSIEVFCGNGEVVFSSRIFTSSSLTVKILGHTQLHITQYKIKRSF